MLSVYKLIRLSSTCLHPSIGSYFLSLYVPQMHGNIYVNLKRIDKQSNRSVMKDRGVLFKEKNSAIKQLDILTGSENKLWCQACRLFPNYVQGESTLSEHKDEGIKHEAPKNSSFPSYQEGNTLPLCNAPPTTHMSACIRYRQDFTNVD